MTLQKLSASGVATCPLGKEVQNGKQCNVYSAMDQNHHGGYLCRHASFGCDVVDCLGLDMGAQQSSVEENAICCCKMQHQNRVCGHK